MPIFYFLHSYNCRQEFQIHDNFLKADYKVGRISESLPEHYLVKVRTSQASSFIKSQQGAALSPKAVEESHLFLCLLFSHLHVQIAVLCWNIVIRFFYDQRQSLKQNCWHPYNKALMYSMTSAALTFLLGFNPQLLFISGRKSGYVSSKKYKKHVLLFVLKIKYSAVFPNFCPLHVESP